MHNVSAETLTHATAPSSGWLRLPSKGRDPVFGLSRAWYYQQIKTGAIRSSCLRQRGKLTGVRLINIDSVCQLIEQNSEGGAK